MKIQLGLKFLLFSFFLCLGVVSIAQESNESKTISTNEGEYIIHKVEKGQTLYAISKLYSVPVDEIQKVNPELKDFGIRIDQTLRIPVKEINKKEAKKSEVNLVGDTIYHEVLKKETFYALSKQYDMPVEEIQRYNPQSKEGLKIGMILKIPSRPSGGERKEEEKFDSPKKDSLKLHEIQPQETLYSLSKQYGVSIDSIQMVNDGLAQGLQVGATIRIPIQNPDFAPTDSLIQESIRDTMVNRFLSLNDTLRIAIFLPFCVDKNLPDENGKKPEDMYRLTEISLQFYRGFNLAVDSLKMKGYNIETTVYDTKNDSMYCKELALGIDTNQFDLFLGPLFPNSFKCIAKRAKELQIPIVCPVKIPSRLLLGNPYIVKAFSSSPGLVVNMANYIGEQYADSNLVIVSGGDALDARYADILRRHVSSLTNDSVAYMKIWQPSSSNYRSLIKPNKMNTLAIVSSNEGFVSSSLTQLYKLKKGDTRIKVFGIDSWQQFKSIDLEYWMDLEVAFPKQVYVNYQDSALLNLFRDYRSIYYTDPSEFVLRAFDLGMYFGDLMMSSNGNWQDSIESKISTSFTSRYKFVKIGVDSGYENTGGFILQYKDFEEQLIK